MHARVFEDAGPGLILRLAFKLVLPSVMITTSAPGIGAFAAQWLAYIISCQRFAGRLAAAGAWLGVSADRSSFTAADFHRVFSTGLPAHYHVPAFRACDASSNKPSLVVVVESLVSEERMRGIFADIDARLAKNVNVGAYDQKI